MADHEADGFEGVEHYSALGRTVDVLFAAEDEDGDADHEHAEAEEVGRPESDVALHVGGCEEGEGADVDRPGRC